MTQLRIIAMFLLLAAGCLKKDNPNYCPGLNPDDNCTERDGGVQRCDDSTQCSAPAAICDTQAGTCVQCTAAQSAACTGVTPICGTDHRCRGCQEHQECSASDACLPYGACADTSDVAYADALRGIDNMACDRMNQCSLITTALATARPYLKLQGMFNEAVTIANHNVTILAAPGTVLTRSDAGNILTINGTSNVQIYDLAINGASGSGAGISLSPAGSQVVTLNHVSMSNNAGTGAVYVYGGRINIYRSVISNNGGGGISILMAPFDIENNFIVKNGNSESTYGGILFNTTNTEPRILSFNTISANRSLADFPAGVSCSMLTKDVTFSNNIVFDNIIAGSGAQVGGGHCLWAYSNIGPGSSPIQGDHNLNMLPGFSPMADNFHLVDSSPMIDRADPEAKLEIDIDGNLRPQGKGRDIGADEYRAMPAARAATAPSP